MKDQSCIYLRQLKNSCLTVFVEINRLFIFGNKKTPNLVVGAIKMAPGKQRAISVSSPQSAVNLPFNHL